jgi:16S rRNA (cytosine1402-N4)-methyltransferase
MTPEAHIAVMLNEVLDGLRVRNDGTYFDGTFGRGGHARAVLAKLGSEGRLLLMDRDPEAVAAARDEFGDDARVAIRHGDFADLAEWPATQSGLDGVLLDLGVSSPQMRSAVSVFAPTRRWTCAWIRRAAKARRNFWREQAKRRLRTCCGSSGKNE